MSESEEWRPVVGWEGLYEVSSLGRVRSLDRRVNSRWGRTRLIPGRGMTPYTDIDGYPCFTLNRGQGRKVNRKASRLVAEAFIPNIEGFPFVRHMNDVKTDNRVENLAWGTASDNARDSIRNGTSRWSGKTHCDRGHEYTPETTYTRPNGNRECRTCMRSRKKVGQGDGT